jgi:hypothetical protein
MLSLFLHIHLLILTIQTNSVSRPELSTDIVQLRVCVCLLGIDPWWIRYY